MVNAALDPDARRAVVVLTYGAGDGCAVGFHLLDPAISLAPLPVSLEAVRRYRELRRAAKLWVALSS